MMYNSIGDYMNGILIINKPLGMSSHDCVNIIRRALKTKKVGHSGTLDVEASGVLVLGINKGTKLLNYLNQDDKVYQFTVRFGEKTDTLDHTGKQLDKSPVQQLDDFETVLKSFEGTYEQIPPAYSAVKVDGKKLYEYARNNLEVPEVPPRKLNIYALKQLSAFTYGEAYIEVDLEVHASKGLYVRKLAEDIALKYNTFAHTRAIHRIKAGDFTIADAYPLETVSTDTQLISLANALRSIPTYTVKQNERFAVVNGQRLNIDSNESQLKIVDEHGKLLAVYEKTEKDYRAKNVFA